MKYKNFELMIYYPQVSISTQEKIMQNMSNNISVQNTTINLNAFPTVRIDKRNISLKIAFLI